MPELVFTGIIVVVVLIVLSIFFTFFPLGLWISAIAAGVKVSIFTLVGMRLRRVIPSRVINPMIKAHKAGLAVTINQLESHYLAGGNVDRVINALIAAHRANIVSLTFERCAAIDLAGRDVLQAVIHRLSSGISAIRAANRCAIRVLQPVRYLKEYRIVFSILWYEDKNSVYSLMLCKYRGGALQNCCTPVTEQLLGKPAAHPGALAGSGNKRYMQFSIPCICAAVIGVNP